MNVWGSRRLLLFVLVCCLGGIIPASHAQEKDTPSSEDLEQFFLQISQKFGTGFIVESSLQDFLKSWGHATTVQDLGTTTPVQIENNIIFARNGTSNGILPHSQVSTVCTRCLFSIKTPKLW
ncbi:MAG: hypothetical protein R3A11_06760 [Bdellovibrionota bacterium]